VSEISAGARPGDPSGRWRRLDEFAYVERAFRDVRRLLADEPGRIVAESARAHLRGLALHRDIHMAVGELGIGVHSARVPIRWEAARHPGFFPLLDATLDFTPATGWTGTSTQVKLSGRYRPPLGRVGELADTLAGKQLAVESVQGFLDELVRRLEDALPAAPSPG
jgi:hypothetical protein